MRTPIIAFATMGLVLITAISTQSAPLTALKEASCDFRALNRADLDACLANPTCLATEEIGAYARNGGSTSKLEKMCSFRVDQLAATCAAGKTTEAHIIAERMQKAMENWIGQSIKYCRRGQMNCAHVVERLGAAWVAETDLGGIFEVTRRRVWQIARDLPHQETIELSAISILAEVYNRLDAPTLCTPE